MLDFILGKFACFFLFCCNTVVVFHKVNFCKKILSEIQTVSVKQFGSRSGLMFCWTCSESELFAKVISRWYLHPKNDLFFLFNDM